MIYFVILNYNNIKKSKKKKKTLMLYHHNVKYITANQMYHALWKYFLYLKPITVQRWTDENGGVQKRNVEDYMIYMGLINASGHSATMSWFNLFIISLMCG